MMQAPEQETEPDLFEVVLYFEGNSWAFSTCAYAALMQEALERAEKEFSVHSLHHQLGHAKLKATSAYVIGDYDHYFTKLDGKWQLSNCAARHTPAIYRKNMASPAPADGGRTLIAGE